MHETSRPMTGSRQQNLLLMVVVLSLAATAGLFFAYLDQSEFFYGRLSRGQMFGRDFASFWTASQLALADRIAEIFDAEAFHRALSEITGRAITLSPFPYPPHALVFFLPLALLPYAWAFAAWMIGLWVLYALVAARGGANAYRALVLLIAPSTVLTVTMGQNGFLSAILFVGGMNLLWRAPIWAGILFGLLTFKPQLGLLIPVALLAGCHWRAVASASATAVVLLGGSLIVLGAETWELYLSTTASYQRLIMEQGTGALKTPNFASFVAASTANPGTAPRQAANAHHGRHGRTNMNGTTSAGSTKITSSRIPAPKPATIPPANASASDALGLDDISAATAKYTDVATNSIERACGQAACEYSQEYVAKTRMRQALSASAISRNSARAVRKQTPIVAA